MEMKKDTKADAIANLYRAALYLGRGSKKVGLDFYQKAKDRLGLLITLNVKEIERNKDLKYVAEKILEEYKKLKMGLS